MQRRSDVVTGYERSLNTFIPGFDGTTVLGEGGPGLPVDGLRRKKQTGKILTRSPVRRTLVRKQWAGVPKGNRGGGRMAKGQVTRRQKDVSRLLREKKRLPPPEKFRKGGKEKKR